MSQSNIENEIKWYSRLPGYPLSYLVGRHFIDRLKKELKAELGSRFDERAFHDAVADCACLPFVVLKNLVRPRLASRIVCEK